MPLDNWEATTKLVSTMLPSLWEDAWEDRGVDFLALYSANQALNYDVREAVLDALEWPQREELPHPELHNFLKRVNMREILKQVFGELQPCRMEFYSESAGEVFQSEPQTCGSATYFYVFELDDDPEPCFTVDLWYSREGFLMSPRLEALSKVFVTEEDATNVKANGAAWAAQNLERVL